MTDQQGRRIAIVRDYAELLDALRVRAGELGITRETLDEVSGLPTRYAAKLLAPGAPRSLGRISMGPILGALGIALVVVEDPEALKRVQNRLEPGVPFRMANGAKNAPVVFNFSRRYMRKLGASGGKSRAASLSAYWRQAIARKGGLARQAKRREDAQREQDCRRDKNPELAADRADSSDL